MWGRILSLKNVNYLVIFIAVCTLRTRSFSISWKKTKYIIIVNTVSYWVVLQQRLWKMTFVRIHSLVTMGVHIFCFSTIGQWLNLKILTFVSFSFFCCYLQVLISWTELRVWLKIIFLLIWKGFMYTMVVIIKESISQSIIFFRLFVLFDFRCCGSRR